jgi:acetylornithine/succinyldiaminopimelate/putrescine aminotransferase
MLPALTVTEDELKEGVARLSRAIGTVKKAAKPA